MTEAEIAAEVAKAVANHDLHSSALDEIQNNAETLTLMLVSMVGGLWALGSVVFKRVAAVTDKFHTHALAIQRLEDNAGHETRENQAAHGRLQGGSEKVLSELAAFRQESKTQHDDLGARLDAQSSRISELESKVSRLVGRAEGQHRGAS